MRPIRVRVGQGDGTRTEVTGDLQEGDRVVIGQLQTGDNGAVSNPFTPQMFGGKKVQ